MLWNAAIRKLLKILAPNRISVFVLHGSVKRPNRRCNSNKRFIYSTKSIWTSQWRFRRGIRPIIGRRCCSLVNFMFAVDHSIDCFRCTDRTFRRMTSILIQNHRLTCPISNNHFNPYHPSQAPEFRIHYHLHSPLSNDRIFAQNIDWQRSRGSNPRSHSNPSYRSHQNAITNLSAPQIDETNHSPYDMNHNHTHSTSSISISSITLNAFSHWKMLCDSTSASPSETTLNAKSWTIPPIVWWTPPSIQFMIIPISQSLVVIFVVQIVPLIFHHPFSMHIIHVLVVIDVVSMYHVTVHPLRFNRVILISSICIVLNKLDTTLLHSVCIRSNEHWAFWHFRFLCLSDSLVSFLWIMVVSEVQKWFKWTKPLLFWCDS